MLILALAAGPAVAQLERRTDDLIALARILGVSHHLQRLCAPADDQVWRARMQELMELEDPAVDVRERMVAAFNAGFEQARRNRRTCDAAARRDASEAAARGATLTARLADALPD